VNRIAKELEVFQSGVSRQEALNFLQLQGRPRGLANEELESAIAGGRVRFAGGNIHARRRPRIGARRRLGEAEAVRHLNAATAIMPQLDAKASLPLNVDKAFDPFGLCVAIRHLRMAMHMFKSDYAFTGNQESRRSGAAASAMTGKLTRLIAPASWDSVARLLESGHGDPAFFLATDLLNQSRGRPGSANATQYLFVAVSASVLRGAKPSWLAAGLSAEPPRDAEALFRVAIDLAVADGDEWLELAARSLRLQQLLKNEAAPESIDAESQLVYSRLQAFASLGVREPAAWTPISARWALWFAKQELDPGNAMPLYQTFGKTLEHHTDLILSGIGAAAMIGDRARADELLLDAPVGDKLIFALSDSVRRFKTSFREQNWYANLERWAIGLAVVLKPLRLEHLRVPGLRSTKGWPGVVFDR
jgi:hypothetical protein